MNREILNIVNKVLSEEITGRIKNVNNKIFEYKDMKKQMCSECGGKMLEGECMECGNMSESDNREIGGMDNNHPRFGKKSSPKKRFRDDFDNEEEIELNDYLNENIFKKLIDRLKGNHSKKIEKNEYDGLTDEQAKRLYAVANKVLNDGLNTSSDQDPTSAFYRLSMAKDTIRKLKEYFGDIFNNDNEDDNNDDSKEIELDEKLYGKQYRIDKNKNNIVDREDLRMLRAKKTTNKYSDELDENDCVECDKGAMYELDMNESTGDKLYFYESEMIDMIETIVLEEKKKSKNKPKGKSKNPIKLTKDNQDKSKKQNDDYIESVVKKMKGYLKDGSKGKYEMNPKHFPKGNGELEVMDKMAYIPSNAVKDYTDNYTAAGLENIDFKDGIKPDEDFMNDLMVGSSRTGNNPDWANAVETPVNQKRNQIRKDNLLSKLKAKAYNKAPQPVTDVTGSKTDKASKVLINLESIEDKKIISDIEKMKNLFQNIKKTQ